MTQAAEKKIPMIARIIIHKHTYTSASFVHTLFRLKEKEEVHTCHELLVYIGDLAHIIAREHNNYIHEKNDGILILDIHVHPICWS